jgi:hypothetical protein
MVDGEMVEGYSNAHSNSLGRVVPSAAFASTLPFFLFGTLRKRTGIALPPTGMMSN